MGEGEAIHIGPKGQRLHKSHVKVTAAQHEAAMKKGAHEIKPGAVIYKQGGKLYMIGRQRQRKSVAEFPGEFRRRLLRSVLLSIGANLTGASGTGNLPLVFLAFS